MTETQALYKQGRIDAFELQGVFHSYGKEGLRLMNKVQSFKIQIPSVKNIETAQLIANVIY